MPHDPQTSVSSGDAVLGFRQFAYLLRLKKHMAETVDQLEAWIAEDRTKGQSNVIVDVARARQIIARFEAMIQEIEDPLLQNETDETE